MTTLKNSYLLAPRFAIILAKIAWNMQLIEQKQNAPANVTLGASRQVVCFFNVYFIL